MRRAINFPVVVVGGSAGALPGLLVIAGGLPADFPGALLVVVHLPPDAPSHLPELLARAGPLPARPAGDGEELCPGQIYVAPPDHHLLLGERTLRLSRGPRENRSRPAVDVLFRSAAYTHGPLVAGVVLSGMLDDGTSGLWTVKHFGGLALVQNPEEAEYPSMPLSALKQVEVDDILPVSDIGPRLARWARAPGSGGTSVEDDAERRRAKLELDIAQGENAFASGILNEGPLSTFTCPECHGVMVQLKEGTVTRFRCHTGHAFTADSLLSELRGSVEGALWSAVRALDEKVMLLEHFGKHAEEAGEEAQARVFREEARDTKARARVVRGITERGKMGEKAPSGAGAGTEAGAE